MSSIGAGSRLLGLEYQTKDGPKSHGLSVRRLFSRDTHNRADQGSLQSTLDHSIWFYAYVISLGLPVRSSSYLSETSLTAAIGCFSRCVYIVTLAQLRSHEHQTRAPQAGSGRALVHRRVS
jgi:hypothetical protein